MLLMKFFTGQSCHLPRRRVVTVEPQFPCMSAEDVFANFRRSNQLPSIFPHTSFIASRRSLRNPLCSKSNHERWGEP